MSVGGRWRSARAGALNPEPAGTLAADSVPLRDVCVLERGPKCAVECRSLTAHVRLSNVKGRSGRTDEGVEARVCEHVVGTADENEQHS